MNTSKINSPWVLVEIDNVIYGISCEAVLSLSQIPEVTPLPRSPREVRGVVDFRTKSIQLIDTRILLNIKSIIDEISDFSNMLNQRYQDHVNWVDTLDKSIKLDSEFNLTTDPHQCAFGKWYDSYHPKTNNVMFLSTFAKFDAPHKAIHQVAISSQKLVEEGKKDEAIKLIDSIKHNEVKQMFALFEDLKEAYMESLKELLIVIGDENSCIGLSIDQVRAIEHLFEIDEDFVKESLTSTEYLSGVAKRKDGSVVFLLNDEYILSKYH